MPYFLHGFKNIFNFQERANRSEYLFYGAAVWVACFIVTMFAFGIYYALDSKVYGYFPIFEVFRQFIGLFGTTIATALTILLLGIIVRRIHDVDMNPLLAFVFILPVFGFLFWIALGSLPTKPYPNKWGEKAWEPEPVSPYQGGYGQQGYTQQPPQYVDPQAPQYGAPQPPQYGSPQPPQPGAPQPPQYGSPQPPQYGAPQPPQYGAPQPPSQPSPGSAGPDGSPQSGSPAGGPEDVLKKD